MYKYVEYYAVKEIRETNILYTGDKYEKDNKGKNEKKEKKDKKNK